MNEDFGEASFLFIKPYGIVGCSFFPNKYFIIKFRSSLLSRRNWRITNEKRWRSSPLSTQEELGTSFSALLSQRTQALLCLEMGFRLKVTLLCDFCAFRKKLSVLQMACSCHIWQESTRVSKQRLLLVSYCELTSHFSIGFLLSVRTLV